MLDKAGEPSVDAGAQCTAPEQAQDPAGGQASGPDGDLSSEELKARSLAVQCSTEFIRLSEHSLSANVVRTLPQWLVTQHNVIAVKFKVDTLYVAMSNPLDLPTLDCINLVTGLNVRPLVATHREITQAINRYYGAEQITRQGFVDAQRDGTSDLESDKRIERLAISEKDGQIVRLVNSIVKDAIDSGASDIHFEPAKGELLVRMRVDGILRDFLTIPATMRKAAISRIKVLANMNITEKRRAQDGHIQLGYGEHTYDLRVSILPTVDGEKTVIRVLDKSRLPKDIASLGLSVDELSWLEGAIHRPHGMILVTGPTGSGKTTTLYAVLQSINSVEKNVVTIENPVEYRLDRINQVQIEADSGESFAGALRSILRQDPDVIMVGEIRDLETARIAVQAALTGHLVLSTLHTNDASTAVTRLRELGIPPYLLSSCVIMAIAQRLIRKVCADCRQPHEPDPDTLRRLGLESKSSDQVFYKGTGCKYCLDAGFRGREAVFEILRVTSGVQAAIAADQDAHQIKEAARRDRMQTLMEAALGKARQGRTTLDEVRRVVASEIL